MRRFISLFAFLTLIQFNVSSQDSGYTQGWEKFEDKLGFRCIGPFRGGRSAAVTGVEGNPMLFYMGATGGGVWKTTNGGSTWENISDGYFGGSIGAIAVSKSHNNIIYVGCGEVTVRGNVSYGTGMYKSKDGGRSWSSIGLPDSRHIARIRIHPKNPDIVYAAVLGDLYKGTQERGVYKTIDGGKTWERVLFANQDAGAVDLVLDPVDSDIIYFSSGGEGSTLWKSKDAGKTWEDLSKSSGFPTGTLGIIGVTVSPVDPDRVWAIIENENGGVFRSEDGGSNWTKTNSDRSLRQRAWYYSRIYADPQDVDRVYVMNVAYHSSSDGGKTFKARYAPHGDHHDLWIAPEDPKRMIIGDDGGAQVTYDRGDSWSTYMNQPTSQFYRVTTDNHFPYRIYGAQQDNSAIRISSRSDYGFITEEDWESTAGGESAWLAPYPTNNDIVYGGSYGGYLTRYNHKTGQNRAINVWPDNPIGYGAEGMKYRFQWNFPVFFSPHDDKKLYACSQHLHMSMDGGESWKIMSPDLSRNDASKLVSSGGPITKDNTGVEYYATIFAATESVHEEGVIWCGSDDGLLHITRDNGENWTNVTPKNLPEWALINSIELDPHNKGGLYVVATMYKTGDYQPYLYYTSDYGKTWKTITKGIPDGHFTRVLRADPEKKGLLYCGTEGGLYMSNDNGANWKPFQLNLPLVPITDLAIKNTDLIVATQGRSFWILDDLNIIREELSAKNANGLKLYSIKETVGVGGASRADLTRGSNYQSGVVMYFDLPNDTSVTTLKFMNENNELIRTFSTNDNDNKLSVEVGVNKFTWDTRYPKADEFDGLLMWWGTLSGPTSPPGEYTARLINGRDSTEVNFTILPDPRAEGAPEDRKLQFEFLLEIRNKLDETHDAIRQMRNVRGAINDLSARLDDKHQNVLDAGKRIDSVMMSVEKALYQVKLKSNQDMLNFPIKLNNKLAHVASLASMGIYKPTAQMIEVKDVLTKEIDQQLEVWYKLKEEELPRFNQLIRDSKIDVISAEDE
jgi:photosystem II stability/assembly factor-like uncharacterized protein